MSEQTDVVQNSTLPSADPTPTPTPTPAVDQIQSEESDDKLPDFSPKPSGLGSSGPGFDMAAIEELRRAAGDPVDIFGSKKSGPSGSGLTQPFQMQPDAQLQDSTPPLTQSMSNFPSLSALPSSGAGAAASPASAAAAAEVAAPAVLMAGS
jgi:hypothetical protein